MTMAASNKCGKTTPGGWIDRVCGCAAALLAVLPMLWLGAASLIVTADFDHETFNESVILTPRNPLLALCTALCLAAVLIGLGWLLFHLPRVAANKAATGIVWAEALAVTLLSVAWALSLHAVPQADQKSVWDIACALAADTPETMPINYLQMYPHQSGIELLLSVFVRLFGTDPMPAFGIFNGLCVGACVLALCSICRRLTENVAAAPLCGLLCLLFLPLPFYSGFVYGTLAAPALAFWGLYGVVRLCRGGRAGWAVLPLLLLPLAVGTYTGALIFSVAAALALLFAGIAMKRRFGWKLFLTGGAALILCLGAEPAAQAIFCAQTGLPAFAGAPTAGWIMMGIHSENGTAGPGSFDGSSSVIFSEQNGDVAATEKVVQDNLRQYIKGYQVDGERFRNFFSEKTKSQWLDPWFGALVMSFYSENKMQGPPATLFYEGTMEKPARELLGTLLTMVYLAAAAGVVVQMIIHRGTVWALLPAIAFLGGFLFQFVWESKSRYCFPYFMLLLPLAAIALGTAAGKLSQKAR